MNGTCKLCGQTGLLRESHIIPDFYIRGLEHKLATGSQGVEQPFSTFLSANPEIKGGTKQRGHWEKIVGIKEYLLCGKCEGKFSKNENYARNLFYGNTTPLKKLPIGDLMSFRYGNDLLHLRKVNVDYKRLKLFQLSILWRAGVAKGSFFKEVELGEFHETKMRTLLNTENPGSALDYPCLMVDLQHDRSLESYIEQPAKSKKEGQRNYRFVLGGYLYLFTVSKQKPRVSARDFCLKPSGEMILPIMDDDKILRNWATTLRKTGQI
jgi:hypothetical protein